MRIREGHTPVQKGEEKEEENEEEESYLVNILLCCSGSVASLKVPELATKLSQLPARVAVVASGGAEHFLRRAEVYDPSSWRDFQSIGGMDIVFTDEMEWSMWNKIGDSVLHIELRRWADLILLAPASANTMAKIASGLSDSLLLSVIRAADEACPKVLCPAMNTVMYENKLTHQHLAALKDLGWKIVYPMSKKLACGDEGAGALASVPTIVDASKREAKISLSARAKKKYNEDMKSIEKLKELIDAQKKHCFDTKISGGVDKTRHSTVDKIYFFSVGIALGIFLCKFINHYN